MSEAGAAGGGRPPAPTAISLYAVQAPHRPLRLSLYTWASRGKTHHRLLLNWKGPSSVWDQASPEPGSEFACPNAAVCWPWDAESRGHADTPDPAGAPAPVHIAVACPEPPPPPASIAPAFDSSGITLLSGEGEQVGNASTVAGRSSAGDPLRPRRGQGPVRRERVRFSIGAKVVGPPRVVMEGR